VPAPSTVEAEQEEQPTNNNVEDKYTECPRRNVPDFRRMFLMLSQIVRINMVLNCTTYIPAEVT
jgi:hypothetical protein